MPLALLVTLTVAVPTFRLVKQNAPNARQDPEVKFILDIDLFMGGQIDPRMAAGGLETLHGHSTPLFQGAVTDRLHSALEPRQA